MITSESPNKLLQTLKKMTTLRQPIHFSRVAQFLATFLRLSCYNFRTALTKPFKLHSLEITF